MSEDPWVHLSPAMLTDRHSIWLFNLANRSSSYQLDGFDVSSLQFPPKEWLPTNVSLQVLDATKEPPDHLSEKYDVVHLRLFLAVIQNNDPTPVLKHCLQLLSKFARPTVLSW